MKILLGTTDLTFESLLREASQRFPFEWSAVRDGSTAHRELAESRVDLVILDFDLPEAGALAVLRQPDASGEIGRTPAIVRIWSEEQRGIVEAAGLPRTEVVPALAPIRLLMERMIPVLDRPTRVVCLGGGTGLFTLLSGLKTIQGLSLCSVVAMTDDGGSTGRLRDRFGILPPGDVRRSLVALSSAPDLLNRLMEYRFPGEGELAGHNLGNLILAALSDMRGSMSKAIAVLGEIMGIEGDVVPVTEESATLMARLMDGTVIAGENRIDVYEAGGSSRRIDRVWCEPTPRANKAALKALWNADLIVLGPGDLFTSVIANLLVEGLPEAIRKSSAKRVFVCNVMTEPGETCGYTAADHVRQVVRYLGTDCLDHIVCSTTRFSAASLAHYSARGQQPVFETNEAPLAEVTRARVFRADVACDSELVRHDSLKLAVAMRDILRLSREHPGSD